MSEVNDCWRELIRQTRSYLAILREGGFAYAEGKFDPVLRKQPPRSTAQVRTGGTRLRTSGSSRIQTVQLPKEALADPYAHLSASKSRKAPAAPSRTAPQPAGKPVFELSDPFEAQARIAAVKNLDELRELVAGCRLCHLSAGRTQPVFGEGNPNADLVFVGEAPGYHEDIQGMPFVGRAGALLTKMIEAIDLTRDQVYICNILKSRPPNNRDPQPAEIKACEPFLIRQLELIRPKVICALGRIAIQALLRDTTPVGKLRGKWRTYQGIPLMPTFHPAYLLRSPNQKRPAWEDLQAVRAKLDELTTKG